MRVINLASGSKGNATLVEHGKTKILIDAGLPLKVLEERLAKAGCSIGEIGAVLVSHTHIDHVKSVAKISTKFGIPVYAPRECFFEEKLSLVGMEQRREVGLEDFFLDEIKVQTFEVSHDAPKTIGFVFHCDGNKVGLVTDVGYLDELILSKLQGSNLVMIESNYDAQMLENGPYPYILKRRIASRMGHLSNFDCSRAILELSKRGTQYFMLMHLSETNNTPEIAYNTVMNVLYDEFGEDNGVRIMLAEQNDVSPNFLFKHREEGE